MNATTKVILAKFREAAGSFPVVKAQTISDAYSRKTSISVISDIKTGKLAAQFQGGEYLIAKTEAERYILANEFIPDEGTL